MKSNIQNVMHADGLGNQTLNFCEDRALLIGAVKRLRTNRFPSDKACVNQLSYLALHRPKSDIGPAGQLTQIEAFPNVAVQN
jgi:hypothetical protein